MTMDITFLPDAAVSQEQRSAGHRRRTGKILARDLSARPLQVRTERVISAPLHSVFEAWTTTGKLSRWFAAEGTLLWKPEVDVPFFFETHFEGERHPHYGRFLRIEQDRLIQLTWVNAKGTKGAETVLTVEFTPAGSGTRVVVTHAGLPDEESRDRHGEAWPQVLEHLENVLSAGL
jgi:uncharacterized protein YndB with AHSA1/START domain